MKPIILNPILYSNNPGNNYLQHLLSYATNQGSTEILFYIEKENITVYRNNPKKLGLDINILKKFMPKKEFEQLKNFAKNLNLDIKKRNKLKGYIQETPLPKKFLKKLEQAFTQVYNLENIEQLKKLSKYQKISYSGKRITTRISKIESEQETGYYMKIIY